MGEHGERIAGKQDLPSLIIVGLPKPPPPSPNSQKMPKKFTLWKKWNLVFYICILTPLININERADVKDGRSLIQLTPLYSFGETGGYICDCGWLYNLVLFTVVHA